MWRSKMGGWIAALMAVAGASAGVALAAGASGARPSTRHQAAHCPGRPPATPPERWPAARHNLAPAGASEIRLCRYSGLNAHPPRTLAGARLVKLGGLVAQLVKRFDGLPSGAPGAVACPADDASEIAALVSYPGGREVRISVALSGCLQVTNGSVNRTASGYGPHPRRGPRLLAELKRLVDAGPSNATAASGPGRWSVLAPSPLGPRSQPAVVWDGRELLELGGGTVAGHRNVSVDAAAAYDPGRGAGAGWPLLRARSIRAGNAAAWTGREAFVYFNPAVGQVAGGVAGLYNPATNRWRSTGGVPVGPFNDATAVWTGHKVILAGMTQGHSSLQVAAYDPATNHWSRMHPPISRRHPPLSFSLVQTHNGTLLWSLWSWTHRLSPSTSTVYSGVDVLRLTPAGRWITVTGHWPQHQTVDNPVFTGRKILLAPVQTWCGTCKGPPRFNTHGYIADPRTLHLKPIPHGPLDDVGPQIVWTGREQLSVNFGAEITGPGTDVYPGDIAAWNPGSGHWTRGPRAPKQLGDSPALWTGKRLLVLARDGHLLAYAP